NDKFERRFREVERIVAARGLEMTGVDLETMEEVWQEVKRQEIVRVESAVSLSLWQQCLARLQDELPATEFSMWIRPLQAELSD
ncbi:hypothetical protein MJL33_34405, partial [Salmonella enterica subsp. enterica serovar Kentucky]|nr:hypothetical protein [Salmonella enterica subsp. enterica serovar Kentucky]